MAINEIISKDATIYFETDTVKTVSLVPRTPKIDNTSGLVERLSENCSILSLNIDRSIMVCIIREDSSKITKGLIDDLV